MSYHFKIIYSNTLIINKLFRNKDKEKENPPKNQLKIQNKFLFPRKVIGRTRKLIGGRRSTSYVLLDELSGIKIAYSFGIGTENWHISFDKELADKNIDIFMYDHTINKLPYENPKFHFHKIGLSGISNKNNPSLKTLYQILEENNHLQEKNMILKVDCEGCEWESLSFYY